MAGQVLPSVCQFSNNDIRPTYWYLVIVISWMPVFVYNVDIRCVCVCVCNCVTVCRLRTYTCTCVYICVCIQASVVLRA